MRIVFHECKKALTSPILISLFVLFTAYNTFLIAGNISIKKELQVANELSETYGREITDASLEKLEWDLQVDRKQVTVMTGKAYEEIDWTDMDMFSEREMDLFQRIQVKEMYAGFARTIDEEYAKIDLQAIAEGEIRQNGVKGQAAKTLRLGYNQLENRFEELTQNNEHKQWFFAGKPYRMHSFLFRTITGHLVFEILILVVLATAFITAYEFENRTQLHTYASKRGRSLMKDKLAASLIITTLATLLLMLVTFGVYFAVFDYTHLWKISINSAFNWEYNLPYITWWDMPFWKFLLLVSVLLYICMLIFTAITYAIAAVTQNSYGTFFIFAILFAVGFLLPGFMPLSSDLKYIAAYNIAALVVNPHMLFTGGNFVMFKYYEITTVAIGIVVSVVWSMYATRYVNKQDIQ